MRSAGAAARTLAAAAVLLATAVAASAGTPATTANDVCAANANPCNVTTTFDVTNDAVLDFGTRTVNVTGGGQFNFDKNNGKIACGNFTASTTSAAIDAVGPDGLGGTTSGTVTLLARRLCSGGNQVPCVDLNDCQIGTCGVRRCSLRPAKTCTADANCQLGTCGANKRCSGSVTFVRCDTNADCDYGTCPAQLTCSNRAENPVACASNTDCDYGTCSVGSASISMGGSILGSSDNPATVLLRAADSVSISKLINLNSTSLESDGGDLTVDAGAGSITLTNKINANGGGDSQGGSVEFNAGTDITISDEVDVIGGDFDGGSVDLSADRDITIGRSLIANSASGAGFGGDITIDAGRDFILNGVSAANKTTMEASGHTDAENFAGDGGTLDLTSGRDMALNLNTRMIGLGSQPDGYGSDVFLDVGRDLTDSGDITAKALGGQGSGGFVEIIVAGKTTVGSAGTFDVTGGNGGGGVLEFDTSSNADYAGSADVSGGSGGPGGSVFWDVDGSANVSGTMLVGGTNGGSLEVDACRISLAATGNLDNNASNGDNTLVARESMKLLAGSQMTAVSGGTNTLRYRTAAKPPLVQGTVTPTPSLVVDGTLVGCPVCGNGEVDQGETCDDGNTTSGDGCSADCQNEKCIQQTVSPGYPTVALCEDGNLCTADVCNTALNGGTCQHPAKNCDDSFACTTDSCDGGTGNCVHVTHDELCNDNNDCTDDFCSEQVGCTGTANTAPCDDQNSCTESDVCADKVCSGTPIQGCGVCGDGQVNPPEQCDDGNATFTSGEYCGVGCVLIPCGKPTNSSGVLPKSSDALFILKAAVGQVSCSKRVCDVDNNGSIVASDALRTLRKAVGQSVTLTCPSSGS